jgi:hypothetical protein
MFRLGLYPLFLALFALTQTAISQPAKYWNISEALKEQGVESIHGYSYACESGLPVDSCPNGQAMLNESGQVVTFLEHRACGMVCAEQHFVYDETGRLAESSVAHAFNRFEEVAFIHEYQNDQLISRTTSIPINGYWQKEEYIYNDKNKIIAIKQWNEQNGQWVLREKIDLKTGKERRKNTMSYVFDEAGLLLVHNIYVPSGLRQIDKFFYSFR